MFISGFALNLVKWLRLYRSLPGGSLVGEILTSLGEFERGAMPVERQGVLFSSTRIFSDKNNNNDNNNVMKTI